MKEFLSFLSKSVNLGVNQITEHFGFDNVQDFYTSIIHPNLLAITIPLAAISGFLEIFLGLKFLTVIAFVTLTGLELATGLILSRKNKIRITSRRFSRFGLKLLVWLCLIGLSNLFRLQYKDMEGINNVLASGLFSWLHTSIFVYISTEYFISVGENLSKITGKDLSVFKNIKRKVDEFFKVKK